MVKSIKFKIGIIGCGLQGRRRAEALKQFDDVKLLAVTDIDHQKAISLAQDMGCEAAADWKDMVTRKDLNIIAVCTPQNSHPAMCTTALKQGKHVLCEKPLARNPTEAEKIMKIVRKTGLKLDGGFNHRHHTAIKQAHDWLDQGIIGEPFSIRICYGIGGRPGFDKEWRADPDIAGGGQLMDQGMHAIDLSRWFLGEFSEAVGFTSTSFWDMAPSEDNAFVLLRTAKAQVSSIHVSWTQWKNLFTLELNGHDGYISVEGLGGSYGVERAILGKREFLKPFKEEIIEYRGADRSWIEEWKEFFNAIREDREPLGNGNDGFQAVRLAYAVYESVRQGRVVKV